jgi:Kef-type K+ transport system membrane component KefB
MTGPQLFLLAMLIIFTVPYVLWRLARTDYYAPLVVVQILLGVILGPGVLGAVFPRYYAAIFTPGTIATLSGVGSWAVMLFVLIAGIELDVREAWSNRRESVITAVLALGAPLAAGTLVALGATAYPGWVGPGAHRWQFVLGVGMACAVTALPILVLLMEKLGILRQPIGQRILRYASLDDVAIWAVLALILADFDRVGHQLAFLGAFVAAAAGYRWSMRRLSPADRWYAALIWVLCCALGADLAGLHFIVGAFLAGASTDGEWFERGRLDELRHSVLLILMPVFFLSTGLRTLWTPGGVGVAAFAAALLAASVAGKLLGVALAGRMLGWQRGEAALIGWLLQTKALIMIIFANVLLDKGIITSATFTALLLMAVASTMLTVPVVTPRLLRLRDVVLRRS